MRAFLLALFFALAPLPATSLTVDAALVQKLPYCSLGNGYDADKNGLVDTGCPGADQFGTEAAQHYTVDVTSCNYAGTAVAYLDPAANNGNGVEIPTAASGVFPHGQMRCLVTPAAGTYTVRVMLRAPNGSTKLWMATAPMLIDSPPGTSKQTDACNTASLCDTSHKILNYGWATMAQTVVSVGSQVALYFTWEDSIQINCIDIATNPSILPVCPSGVTPPTPDYVMLKVTGAAPASCNDLSTANTVTWNGYNGGLVAPVVKMAWKAGTPANGYICVTTTDTDIVAPTTADDDPSIYSGNDYLEWTLTPGPATTDEGSVSFAVNPASPPAKLDGKVSSGVWSTTPDYNMSCAKTGSWSVFCSFDFDFTIANDQLGLMQQIFRDVDSTGIDIYAIYGGIDPLGAGIPANWKLIKYSSTALPVPPPDTTPPTVGSVSFVNVTQNGMQVQFNVSDAGSGVSSAFADYDSDSGVTYCNAQPGSGTCPAPCSINGAVATCSITGLAANTSYFVRGRAIDNAGNTGTGAENNQATPPLGSIYYFNVSTGNDSRPCTDPALPCKSLAKMVSILAPGKTAILEDGTWHGVPGEGTNTSNSEVVLEIVCGAGGNTVSGQQGALITVQAEHSRQVTFDWSSHANSGGAHIRNGCSYWVIDGVVALGHDNVQNNTTGDNGAFFIDNSSNNIIRNSISKGGNSYSNGGAGVLINYGDNNLIEGNEVYNCHRNCFSVYGNGGQRARNNIFRNNYAAQPQTNNTTVNQANVTPGPNDTFVDYATAGPNTWEGNISDMGSYCWRPPGVACNDADFYVKPDTFGSNWYGNISIIAGRRTHGFVTGSQGNSTVTDLVSISPEFGVWFAGAKNVVFRNVGIFDAQSDLNDVYINDDGNAGPPLSVSFINSFSTRAASSASGFSKNSNTNGYTINASANYVKCDNAGGACFTGGGWTTTNTTQSALTGMGACKVYVPVGANVKGVGLNGDDIGPKLLYAYENGIRQDGTGGTIAKPLWDATLTGAGYGKWRYAGAVIAGVNDSSTGNVASTVHQRLGFGGNGCLLPAGYGQPPNVRLGLHVTTAELSVWQGRAVNGPYKSAGDVRTNSPGDWTRIKANGDALVASPTTDRWDGTGFAVTGSCFTQNSGTIAPETNRSLGERTRDTAFSYLVLGTTSYLTAAKNNLLYEAARPNLNFANGTIWCIGPVWDTNPFFDLAHWLVKLVFAYDYIRPSLVSGPNADASAVSTLDTWFLNMGIYWEAVLDQQTSGNFANSRQNNLSTFTLSGSGTTESTTLGRRTYCNGPFDNGLSGKYQNRMTSFANLITQIGVMLNQAGVSTTATAHLITMGKRYFMEYLQFGIMADGTPLEFERGVEDGIPNNAQHGWRYSTDTAASMGMIADAIARTGDPSLYTFSTSNGAGSGGNSTAGGPKTLSLVHLQLARYVNQTETGAPRYSKDSTTTCNSGGSDTLIGPQLNTSTGESSNRDTFLAQSNLYYQSTGTNGVKPEYMRTSSAAAAYPASPEGGGYGVWGGPSGEYPGVLFMFGQMEGVVNPYP